MKTSVVTALAALACLVGAEASAAHYTLWIHGRNGHTTQTGNYADFSYWGPATTEAGVNKKAVNWNGTQKIGTENGHIRDALDCFCTGDNWCYIAAHSAGDLQIGYALSLHGGSTRHKKNATPDASGVCGDSGGTQTGWNIKWVDLASGAAGGIELADYGLLPRSEPLTGDLVTSTARALYDHNSTRSLWFYNFAAARGTLYSALLPGQDDEVVAYHSSGGVAGASGSMQCNPMQLLCPSVLNLGTAACGDGRAKWAFHSVRFRDDRERNDHYANERWENIVGVVRADVVQNAR